MPVRSLYGDESSTFYSDRWFGVITLLITDYLFSCRFIKWLQTWGRNSTTVTLSYLHQKARKEADLFLARKVDTLIIDSLWLKLQNQTEEIFIGDCWTTWYSRKVTSLIFHTGCLLRRNELKWTEIYEIKNSQEEMKEKMSLKKIKQNQRNNGMHCPMTLSRGCIETLPKESMTLSDHF